MVLEKLKMKGAYWEVDKVENHQLMALCVIDSWPKIWMIPKIKLLFI